MKETSTNWTENVKIVNDNLEQNANEKITTISIQTLTEKKNHST